METSSFTCFPHGSMEAASHKRINSCEDCGLFTNLPHAVIQRAFLAKQHRLGSTSVSRGDTAEATKQIRTVCKKWLIETVYLLLQLSRSILLLRIHERPSNSFLEKKKSTFNILPSANSREQQLRVTPEEEILRNRRFITVFTKSHHSSC